jgi:hypothetical protein
MIVARPVNDLEPDLLEGNESNDLIIYDLDGIELERHISPIGKWTHDLLDQFSTQFNIRLKLGWDAYLGESWIGSSEV